MVVVVQGIPVFRPTEASNVEIDARPFCFGRLIEVIGPLDTRSARSFLDVFERAIEQAASAVVVDLRRSRVESLGQAALLRASRRARQLGKTVLIVGQALADDAGVALNCRVLPNQRVAIAAAIASSIRL